MANGLIYPDDVPALTRNGSVYGPRDEAWRPVGYEKLSKVPGDFKTIQIEIDAYHVGTRPGEDAGMKAIATARVKDECVVLHGL